VTPLWLVRDITVAYRPFFLDIAMEDKVVEIHRSFFDNLKGDDSRLEWLEKELALHQAQVDYYARLLEKEKRLQNE
jgi:hypothetical protein